MGWQWAAALALASASGAAIDTAIPPPGDVDLITLQKDVSNRLTVPVTIAGQGPFRFLIDTGAQATVVSRDLADRLALTDRENAILVGAASRVPVETTTIPGLTLGSRMFDVQAAPLVEARYIGGGAEGILGVDSLQNQRVLLDFRKSQMSVADAASLGGNKGYDIIVKARRRLGQLIIANAVIDGVRVAVIIDTGAEGSTGNFALREKLGRRHKLGMAQMTDINGVTLEGAMHQVAQLSLGRAQVHNFGLLFADSPTFHALGMASEPTMVLGMQELRLFRRVAIDFQTQQILFDLPPEASFIGGTMNVGDP